MGVSTSHPANADHCRTALAPFLTPATLLLGTAYRYFWFCKNSQNILRQNTDITNIHPAIPLSLPLNLSLSPSLTHPKLRKPFKLFMDFQIKT